MFPTDPNAAPPAPAAGAPAGGPSANDELGAITAEIDALLGATGGAPGADPMADPNAVDPSALSPEAPDSSPEPTGAADVEVQPLIDGLNLTPEKARELYDAAQVYPPTQGMDPATLADALNYDAQLMADLMGQMTSPEEGRDEQEMFSLGDPPEAEDEIPTVDPTVEDAIQ